MAVQISSKDPDTNYVMHVYVIPLSFRHIPRDVHPDGIIRNHVVEIFTM